MRGGLVGLLFVCSCLYVETTGEPQGPPEVELECSMAVTCPDGSSDAWIQRWCGSKEEAGAACLAKVEPECMCVTSCQAVGLCTDGSCQAVGLCTDG